MDNLEVFLKWFAFGWSVAAVLLFVVTRFYMPNTFADKAMEINMKWRKEKEEKKKTKAQKQLAQLTIRKQTTVDRVQNAMIHMLEKHSSRMSYSYLLNATNCFSDDNVIGLGKLATLYKATIGNGNFLTVKRFKDFPHIEQKFMREIMTNGRLRHKNLVSLLGFGKEKQEKLLVYSYMANGSLYDWLHPMEVGCKRPTLNWPLRYVITVGIARGLAWLHHNRNYRVTHGNICSKFIFLDKQFNPKISSFGGTRIVGSSNVRMRICEKSEFRESDDVYAFGILLVEVITGEKPEDVSNLCEGFDGTLIGGNLLNAIDSSLIGKGFDSEISQVLQVALDCIGLSSNGRSTMLEVYRYLSSIGAKKESAYTFGTSNQIGDGCGTHMAEHSGIDIIEEVE
ncbi:probably inactive leucine-rich repeat receptor-like protein kinase At5g48380 [Rhododendron vialii]|uniref:probably inactive leucine-rich repeat receptor-like protein kinase At5g48380 n=1 Tax=Rhododendron vialii TaxID=182163 RepID=UPI0026603CE9|nr:probably inactive leucine-rich repeat receptor-like protein kinase At5g48380 [Rhododendron vialii]